MSEGYVECLVEAKDNALVKVGKGAAIVLCAIFGVFAILTGNFWIFVIAVIFGVLAYVASGYTSVEYEYLYLDRELTVDKVFNKSKRKRVGVYALDRIEVFAPIKSYHLDNFGKRNDKPIDYSIGFEDKPDLRYIMYYEGGKTFLLSPSPELVKAMKDQAPRKVFSD
ncbi:MAG: DUF6106 family protein [Lachnospiraceae bacterium]|nr:DUF6106 family protein [Lachnospiraceae bacterium]